jgi:hypothetical protein
MTAKKNWVERGQPDRRTGPRYRDRDDRALLNLGFARTNENGSTRLWTGSGMDPRAVTRLQRTAGNAATAQLVAETTGREVTRGVVRVDNAAAARQRSAPVVQRACGSTIGPPNRPRSMIDGV